jgi:hypothetical protein
VEGASLIRECDSFGPFPSQKGELRARFSSIAEPLSG